MTRAKYGQKPVEISNPPLPQIFYHSRCNEVAGRSAIFGENIFIEIFNYGALGPLERHLNFARLIYYRREF
jgi:hypothetical protein